MQGNPKISILIPNKDHVKDLEKCLQSISKSIYKNYEITIIENNSKKAETFAYYDKIESDHIRILRWDGPFNYSAINNYAVSETDGEYLVLLNNDTEVIGKDWLGEMASNCQRKEVGDCSEQSFIIQMVRCSMLESLLGFGELLVICSGDFQKVIPGICTKQVLSRICQR